MFQIDMNDIPLLRTRAAILILDLQNDIIAADGILKVNQPPDFLDKIRNLVPCFRSWGQIMWILTQFEKHRAINDGSADAESVITDQQLPKNVRRARQQEHMSKLLSKVRANQSVQDETDAEDGTESPSLEVDEEAEEDKEEEPKETYLTLGPDEEPRCCIPMSTGVNVHTELMQGSHNGLNSLKDFIFGKTHYSAFKSGALIDRLRSSMVTELFICGALTNISIYATVLDAVRHGYSITIVSDCCGFKSQDLHDEAMRQMTESLGCDIMTSLELIEEIEARERKAAQAKGRARVQRERRGHLEEDKGKKKAIEPSSTTEIDKLMGTLDLQDGKVDWMGRTSSPFLPQPETIQSHLWSVKPPRSNNSVAPPSEFVSPSRRSAEAPTSNKVRVKTKVSIRRRSSKSKPKNESSVTNIQPKNTAEVVARKPSSSAILDDNQGTTSSFLDVGRVSPARESEMKVFGAGKENDMPNLENLVIDDSKRSSDGKRAPTASRKDMSGTQGKAVSHRSIRSATFCEGDSEMITNLFPEPFADHLFENLLKEIIWQRMSHQGGDVPRLIAVQGLVSPTGTHPIYRHPSDESPPLYPFSETVRQIIPYVECALGHHINHVLIQFYRDGTDHITEHTDKTLDIVPGTFIANVSLGAQRTMTFRTKKPISPMDHTCPENGGVPVTTQTRTPPNRSKNEASIPPRTTHKEYLPHNSMCKFGLESNAVWLHGIRPDKRADSERSPEALAFGGSRISLTFRKIGTFLNRNETLIWGQGAVAKDEKNARKVVSGDMEETKKMLKAFGRENKMSGEFDWESEYGAGFDVLHVKNERKLVLSGGDRVAELRIRILLKVLDVRVVICGEGDLMRPIRLDGRGKEVCERQGNWGLTTFVDNDTKRSRVEGDAAIFLYLDRVYGPVAHDDFDLGKCYTRLLQADKPLITLLEDLPLWESFILEHGSGSYLAGTGISLVDYFFWPLLHCHRGNFEPSEVLKSYYERAGGRDGFKWVNEAVSDSD